MLRAAAATVSEGIPYLAVPEARLARGRARAAGRVALCWQAGGWDLARSVPLASLLRACARPGQRFISLQRGPAAAEATAAHFDNPGDADCDVIETAALICGAAAVVTVDTMVAHLAGALGRAATLLVKPEPIGGGLPVDNRSGIQRCVLKGRPLFLREAYSKKRKTFFFEKRSKKLLTPLSRPRSDR